MSDPVKTLLAHLEDPLTEIEKAQLVEAAKATMTNRGVHLLRRALFQLDRLAAAAKGSGR